jgi:hypothetical protein
MGVAAEFVTEQYHREGFFRGEIGWREKILARDAVRLAFVVKKQRDLGPPKRVEVPKNRPPTDATGICQFPGVAPPTPLQQSQEFDDPIDALQNCWLWHG